VWKPDLLVLEDVFVLKQFPKAAIQLGEVRGVICLAAQELGISVLQLKVTEVKSAITGSGRAEKQQIQRMIKRILRIEKPLSSNHAADALALALTGLSRNSNFRW
jgi:crossover junction endodeoxyribonuclease RuvC